MDKKTHIFDEAKKALNKDRRKNKLCIVIWIVYIVVMLVLAVIEGITGRYGSMLNTGSLIILAVYIILLHRSKGYLFRMFDKIMDLVEHMHTTHQEYIEYVESIFAKVRAAAEEEEKKKQED